jgi:hypothetical protein
LLLQNVHFLRQSFYHYNFTKLCTYSPNSICVGYIS